MGVVVSEPPQPPSCGRLTAPPERVKAVDPHRHGLEPFFDVAPLAVVEPTAQLTPSKGSQITTSIDEKLGIGDVVFLGEAMEQRRPQKSLISDGLHENSVLVNAAGSVPRQL
jgi:hypothetical protein